MRCTARGRFSVTHWRGGRWLKKVMTIWSNIRVQGLKYFKIPIRPTHRRFETRGGLCECAWVEDWPLPTGDGAWGNFGILHLKWSNLVHSEWHFCQLILWDVATVTPGSLAKRAGTLWHIIATWFGTCPLIHPNYFIG